MSSLTEELETVLDRRVRPRLRIHGGDVIIASTENGEVRLEFQGACCGCPLAPITFKAVVEVALLHADDRVSAVTCSSNRWSRFAEERLEIHLAAPVDKT